MEIKILKFNSNVSIRVEMQGQHAPREWDAPTTRNFAASYSTMRIDRVLQTPLVQMACSTLSGCSAWSTPHSSQVSSSNCKNSKKLNYKINKCKETNLEHDKNGKFPKSNDKSMNQQNENGAMVSSEGFDDFFKPDLIQKSNILLECFSRSNLP